MLFWNCQISQRATVPGWYFLIFLTFPAWRNSFWGALPPMVGQSFLLAGSSLPDIDGLASAAIWANCWVGNDEGDLPTPSSCSASMILHMISSAWRGASLAGVGGCISDKGFSVLPSTLVAALICSIFVSPSFFPLMGCHICSYHSIRTIREHQSIEKQHDFILHENYIVSILNW